MRTPIASWLRRLDALTPAAASTLGLVLGAAAAATLLTRGSSIVGVVAFVALLALVGALAWSGGGWRSAPTLSLTVAPLPPTQSAITVHLAVSTRPKVRPDSDLTVRFAAYSESFRTEVTEIFRREAPRVEPLLDLAACQAAVGTEVTVSLTARDLEVENGSWGFTWDGKYKVLRFDDVVVPAERQPGVVVLKVDVLIASVVVASLQPEIEIVAGAHAPRSAYASFASADRDHVMARIRSVQGETDLELGATPTNPAMRSLDRAISARAAPGSVTRSTPSSSASPLTS